MSTILENPFQVYTDLNGNPLDNGYIYIGVASMDPVTNPVSVFWDVAGTIPAAQPLRTVNGYIVNAGSPAIAYVTAASYSVLLQDAGAVTVYSSPVVSPSGAGSAYAPLNSPHFTGIPTVPTGTAGAATSQAASQAWTLNEIASAGGSSSGTVANVAAIRAATAGSTSTMITRGYYTSGDGGDATYYLDAADTTSADNGGTVIVSADGKRYKLKLKNGVNVKQFGAKGDWDGTTGTDDAPAFQAAITAMSGIPGGIVYVPPVAKAYRWNQAVTLSSFCTLKGSEELRIPNINAATFAEYYGGHCIAITWGAGTSTGAALTQVYESYIHGLTFLYPGQVTSLTASAPTVFPPTIAGVEGAMPGGSINCCYFVNSYKAIYFIYGHGELKIRSCWGAILGDFITLSGAFNADQMEDVNASGIFYLLGSPDANFTYNTGLYAWIQRNGRAFVLGNADAIRFTNCFAGNCFVGIAFAAAPVLGGEVGVSQYSYGDWVGGGMEGVTFPVYVSGSTTSGISSNGFRFTSAGIAPVGLFNADRAVSLVMIQPTTSFSDNTEQRGHILFTGCEFWGAGSWQTNVGPLEGVVDATGGDIDFIGCTFKVQQTYIARAFSGTPVIKFIGCTALDTSQSAGSYHMVASSGSSGKILYEGCEWRGGVRVFNASSTAIIAESTVPTVPGFAAAPTLALPYEGSIFSVTGTSGTIDSISSYWPGREVTLNFAGAGVGISGSGNIALINGAFTSAASGSMLLRYIGSNYVEVGRTPIAGSGTGPVPATVAPPAIAGSGAVGTSLAYARQDHTHSAQAVFVNFTPPTGMTSTNVQTAIAEVYADIGSGGGGASPFNGTPSSIGSAGPGSSALYARGDHVHAATATNVSVSPPSGFSGTNVQASINETASYIATLSASKAGLIGDPSIDFNAHSWNLLKVQGSGTGGGTTGTNSLTVVGNNAAPSLPALSNTAIGCNAFANATSCSNSTALGTNALLGVNSQGWGNVTGLGAGTQVTGSDQLQLGSSATTSFAYGTVQNRSDERDKTGVRDTVLGLDFINALRPVDFKWDYREDYIDYSTYPVMPIEPVAPNMEAMNRKLEMFSASVIDQAQMAAEAIAAAGVAAQAFAEATASSNAASAAATAAEQALVEATSKAVADAQAVEDAAAAMFDAQLDDEAARSAADAANAAAQQAAASAEAAVDAKVQFNRATTAAEEAAAEAGNRAAVASAAQEASVAADAAAEAAKTDAAGASAAVAQVQKDYAAAVEKYQADFAQYLQAVDIWRATNEMDKIMRDGSNARTRYHHGLIAQDVQRLIAETGVDFGGFQNHALKGGMDVMSIGYEELIAPLIKAVQQLTARVVELEGK